MTSEAAVQQLTRLKHCELTNGQIWRNNTGVFYNKNNQPVRCGLANESAQLNKSVKSSDLIGITPVLITAEMVGSYLGVFTAYECKSSDWTHRPGDARANAQKTFHDIVKQSFGLAGFFTHPDDIKRIIYHETR